MIGRCRDCRNWDQRYPENKSLGVCLKLGVFTWGKECSVHASSKWEGDPPSSDFEAVRTLAEFGCIQFQRRNDEG